MVDDLGEQDPFAITDYYTRFLEKQDNPMDFDIAWAMTELLWSKYRTEPIRITPEEAGKLQRITDIYPGEVPPLTIGQNTFCFEFPVNPPIYPLQKPLELTSMLIATGSEIGIVWQFENAPTLSLIFTPEKLAERLNLYIPNEAENEVLNEGEKPSGFWIAQRRRLLLAWHLCKSYEI